MVGSVLTSEMSVIFNETTRRYIAEYCHIRIYLRMYFSNEPKYYDVDNFISAMRENNYSF
jgi:hypothetical protein